MSVYDLEQLGAVSQNWRRRLRWFVGTHKVTLRSCFWFFLLLLQFGIASFMAYRLGTVLLGVGEPSSKNTNLFCQPYRLNSTVGTVLDGKFTDSPCAFEYNFKRTLIFWVDGISWDTASPIFDQFQGSNIFKVKHKLNPWSAWVFATMMTGKPNRNMGKIPNDNLVHQFARCGMKMRLGVEKSMAYVGYALQEEAEHYSFVDYFPDVTNDDDSVPPEMFNWFFRCNKPTTNGSNPCVDETLNENAAEGRSMYFESFYLDHQVHFGAYNKYTEQIHDIILEFVANIMAVKAWVDAHPEYLLTIISDHGQKTTNSEPGIHGDFTRDGNEGWVLFYNPSITTVTTTPSAPITLNTVDVLPTLWQFFSARGVSIPAENVGVVSPISYNAQVQYNAYKTNLDQLVAYSTRAKIYKLTSLDENIIKWAGEMPIEAGVVQLRMFLDSLSEKIIKDYMSIKVGFPLCVALFSLGGSVAMQFGFSSHGFFSAVKYLGIGVIASVYIAWCLIAFLFENPTSLAVRIEIYGYAVSLFGFLAAYISRNIPPKTHSTKSNGAGFEQLATEENATEMIPTNGKVSVSLTIDESIESVESEDSISLSASTDSAYAAPLSPDSSAINLNEKLVTSSVSYGQAIETNPELRQDDEKLDFDSEFLYVRMWRYAALKQPKACLTSLLDYIFGSYKARPASPETWIMYFVVSFATLAGVELAYGNKFFIVGNVDVLYKHPTFVKIVGLCVLFLEFRFQRISLTSKLYIANTKTDSLLTQLFHPSFWPLNIKTIVYFTIFVLASRSHIGYHLGFFLYGFFFCHIGILLFCSPHIQRDLVLPVFSLLFYVGSNQERMFLCLYFFTMNFACRALEKKQHGRRYILPSLLIAMIMITHFYFAILGRSLYDISNVSVQMPGIEDPTKYPIFSVAIMGVHYFGLFLLLVPFIVRLVNITPPLQPITYKRLIFGHMAAPFPPTGRPKNMLKKQTTTLLLFFASTTAALFYLYVILRSLDDSCTIWAGTILIVCVLYIATVVGSELSHVILLVISKRCA